MDKPLKSDIRVLIVDDNQEFIDRLIANLDKVDPAVSLTFDFATHGDAALAKVKEFLPDVILLDNMLADEDSSFEFISAAEVYQELKNRGFHGISVIVITYDPAVHNVKELCDMGVKTVFNKDDLFYDHNGYANLLKLVREHA